MQLTETDAPAVDLPPDTLTATSDESRRLIEGLVGLLGRTAA